MFNSSIDDTFKNKQNFLKYTEQIKKPETKNQEELFVSFDNFIKEIKDECSDRTWSQGVLLSRNGDFFEDSKTKDKIVYQLKPPNQQISHKVTLWPEVLDWECNCRNNEDPCHHVAGLTIYIRHNGLGRKESDNKSARLLYNFKEDENKNLILLRVIKVNNKETPLTRSIIDFIGGINSGRIKHPPVAITKTDYSLDAFIKPKGIIENFDRSFKLLEETSTVLFNNKSVQVNSMGIINKLHIIDDNGGFRVKVKPLKGIKQIFKNNLVLKENNEITFLKSLNLSNRQKAMVKKNGTFFSKKEAFRVVSEIIPLLKERVQIDIETDKLPSIIQETPYVILETKIIDHGNKLEIAPKMFYGRPPILEIDGENIIPYKLDIVPERNISDEIKITKQLQQDLFLRPGQKVQLEKEIVFKRIETIEKWEISGTSLDNFKPFKNLQLKVNEISKNDWSAEFQAYRSAPGLGEKNSSPKTASLNAVLSAWKDCKDYVPLLEGGWGKLPDGWLEKYGNRLQRLIDLKKNNKKQASHIELSNICEENNILRPVSLEHLKNSFDNYGQIKKYELPKGLNAKLRDYQQMGYNWLRFLKESQMGALLADDMGLGKTLQAISVLEGNCLVVAPTTVIFSWLGELEKFRPNLKVNFYYGKKRKIKQKKNVTLTSYTLLRMDIEKFKSINWDIAVLDESQTIKNPNSQIAKSAYKLQAKYKIALSGTPIENKLDDLWSQFHFINPGFLGTRSEFVKEYVRPINQGQKEIQLHLQQKVKPFILRRLKQNVEKELPAKTETVLHCYLDEEEKEIYDTIKASSQKEIVEKLQKGGSIFSILEILLRLRQSCCHVGMIPGETKDTSSKIITLIDNLIEAKESGHKGLIFSQWTSFLDLLEPHLKSANLNFLRIDGSTKNRKEIIDLFQNRDKADFLIISLKAGGIGMTLTAADQVYIMDPWWNPAVEEQAADRTHRIGQKNPVFVHRLVAKGTIEERILVLQEKKKNLAKAILNGTGETYHLTRQDIIDLLQ